LSIRFGVSPNRLGQRRHAGAGRRHAAFDDPGRRPATSASSGVETGPASSPKDPAGAEAACLAGYGLDHRRRLVQRQSAHPRCRRGDRGGPGPSQAPEGLWGSTVFVHAETSKRQSMGQRSVPAQPNAAARTRPAGASFGARDDRVRRATSSARACASPTIHPSRQQWLSAPEDLAAFLKSTGAAVGLTLDTRPTRRWAAIDPVATIRGAPRNASAHVHCKGHPPPRSSRGRPGGTTGAFLEGVLAGMFTVPGDGGFGLRRGDAGGWPTSAIPAGSWSRPSRNPGCRETPASMVSWVCAPSKREAAARPVLKKAA